MIVRPFFVVAAGFAALLLLANSLDVARIVDDVTSLPKIMMVFVGFCLCVVAMLARLSRNAR